ncbi:MAG: cupin domain-containing protein [Acidobacteria bacterium]|nr:cupin domain-containing protein [Acidobacteriota bacterium]
MQRLLLILTATALFGADPTFLRRRVADIAPRPDDLTRNATGTLAYRPIFGIGDDQAKSLKGIARYGELRLEPGAATAIVKYAAEEQLYYILDGAGTLLYDATESPVRANDFLYLPPDVPHGVRNTSNNPLRLLVMGFKIPRWAKLNPPAKLMVANAADVKPITLAGHGPTVQFKLLMGTTESTRDKLAAANQMASLFIMDFAPGGTNIPHHHETEEEIYYVLRGSGDMVAGGGADGNEGRYPAREGDAYFARLNTTVGFYSGAKEGGPHDLILAVRSAFPFPRLNR